MKKYLLSLISILTICALGGCSSDKLPNWLKFGRRTAQTQTAQRPSGIEKVEGTLLASVNGRVITLEDFNARISAYNSEIQASSEVSEEIKKNYLINSFEDKKRMLEGMIERELVISEASERGMKADPEVRKAIKALTDQLLFAKLIEAEKAKISVSGKEIEEFYNQYKQAFVIPEERRVSMIVLSSETKAKEIMIALLQGSDFSSLARTHSIDPGSASGGGDIGFIVRKGMLPQQDKKTMFEKFEEAAFALELNKPSNIFKGPAGYYLIKVTEIKPARQRLLSEVYSDIKEGLSLKKQEEGLESLVGNLRKSAAIVIKDELLRN